MNVLYIYADYPREWNCSRWNAIIPAKSINRLDGHEAKTIHIDDFIKNTPEIQKICSKANIIVIERNYFSDALTLMQYWKVRGKTILAVFDDAYDLIHPMNASYKFWNKSFIDIKNKEGEVKTLKMKPSPLTQFKWALKIVKGIQVPSVNLAEDWSKYNNTYYVHNFLDIDGYLNVQPLFPKKKNEIVIGWCGSMSHHYSFTDSGVLRALEKIAKQYPQVKILISGDKRIYDMINVEKKTFSKFVPAKQWTPLLKSIDIGLAPLYGEFDKRRSWIKALEYMALKIPWIATNYLTYNEVKDYGKLTKNGYNNWIDAISDVIERYDYYKEIAETTGFEFAQSQSSYEKIKTVTLPLYKKLITSEYPLFENKSTKAYLNPLDW